MATSSTIPWADRVGSALAVLCAIHCVAVPAFVAVSPLFGAVAGSALAQAALVLVALPVSGWALVRGARRHGAGPALGLGAGGFVLLAAGVLAHDLAPHQVVLVASLVGSGLVVAAHVLNEVACRRESLAA